MFINAFSIITSLFLVAIYAFNGRSTILATIWAICATLNGIVFGFKIAEDTYF